MGTEGGGALLARAGAIPFQEVASWEVQGEGFFSEARQAMRGHVATFPASALGVDVIDPDVVSDGEVTEGRGGGDGTRSAGGRSYHSARSWVQKGNKQAAKDSTPPPKKKAGGDCNGQEKCIRTAESGSRQPPS